MSLRAALGTALVVVAAQANAGPAIYGTVGTLGLGAGGAVSVHPNFDLRAEYAGGSVNRSVSDTDIEYDGKYKLSNTSLLVDWYPSTAGIFRVSVGGVYSRNKVTAVGKPTNGTYEFNGTVYTAPPGA